MRLRNVILSFLLLAAPLSALAEDVVAYKGVLEKGYDFLVYEPADRDPEARLPLILFLHGKSICGHNLNSVMRYGCLDAVHKGVKIDAVIVAPQTSVPSWDADKLNDVIDYVLGKYSCDENRIYVIGMSMGGWGTLKVLESYPDKIAAGMAMCGGYTGKSFDGLLKVPLWIIHGLEDEATPYSFSMNLTTKMFVGGKADRLLCDWPSCGHSLLVRIFYLEDTYKWLFAHSLADEGRPVCRKYRISDEKIRGAYNTIKSDPVDLRIVPASL